MFAARYFPDRYFARRYWPAIGAAPADPDIRRIPVEETFAWQRPVLQILATPPGSPTKADRYIVDTGATGAWAGHDGDIAWYYLTGWKFDTPGEGWILHNLDDSSLYLYSAGAWALLTVCTGSATPPFTLLTADPGAPSDDTWWMVRTGTTPTMRVAIKVRISGATYEVAGITL